MSRVLVCESCPMYITRCDGYTCKIRGVSILKDAPMECESCPLTYRCNGEKCLIRDNLTTTLINPEYTERNEYDDNLRKLR